jgi:hypothetical protein
MTSNIFSKSMAASTRILDLSKSKYIFLLPKHLPNSSPMVPLQSSFSKAKSSFFFPSSSAIETLSSVVVYVSFSALTLYVFPHSTEKV